MILGLLALIAWQGLTTFWPVPIERVTLARGGVVMGERFRHEWYTPDETALDSLEPEIARDARAQMDRHDGRIHRALIRTGNFDLTGTHFAWVADHEITSIDHPQWAVTVERESWGRLFGMPRTLTVDGEPVAEGPSEVWKDFGKLHARARSIHDQVRRIEKHEIGRVNRRLESARLELRRAVLRHDPPSAWIAAWRTLDSVRRGGTDADIAQAQRSLQMATDRTGTPSPAMLEAIERYTERQREGLAEFAELSARIAELTEQMERYTVEFETAQGERTEVLLSDIVRAYPANRLGLGDKIGVYLSRWWEFLSSEPREANSEGGVFPAIFGTVAMTLIMSLAVVPFGVLAALHLREYAKGGVIVSVVRIAINNLAGVPSIVFGVFGLGFFSYGLGAFIDGGPSRIGVTPWPPAIWFIVLGVLAAMAVGAFFLSLASFRPRVPGERGVWRAWRSRLAAAVWILCTAMLVVLIIRMPFFDGFYRAKLPSPTFGTGGLLWASLTLALLTLPVVIVATEEALAAVPSSMREGSYACGASKWQTIRRIVLPRAMPGIMTGAILAMARGAGEVAPLMLVGAVKLAPQMPIDGVFPFVHAERSFMHLGFHIYDLGFQSQNSEAAKPMVYTTTLLLITIIVLLNISAIWLRSRLRRRFHDHQF